MSFVWESVVDGIVTGLPFTLVFLGVWFVFALQRDFDLTVDGTFAVGGAVAAQWIIAGGNPWVSLPLAGLAGALGGLITYVVLRRLELSLVLASIIVALGLFTVTLVILGRPNLTLFETRTVYTDWAGFTGLAPRSDLATVSVALLIVVVVYGLVALFLRTELGLSLLASGLNKKAATNMGISTERMLLLSLLFGNFLAGLGGGLLVQQQGFADVSMGAKMILFGITAVLLGQVVLGRRNAAGVTVLTVLVGALLYRTILAAAFRAGIGPQYFQGITAVIVLASIAAGRVVDKGRRQRALTRHGGADAGAAPVESEPVGSS